MFVKLKESVKTRIDCSALKMFSKSQTEEEVSEWQFFTFPFPLLFPFVKMWQSESHILIDFH